MKAVSVLVSGRVQGVYFRFSTREKAMELGITGWCKNQKDGSVLIHAEGIENRLATFLSWCHEGSSMALVRGVESHEVTNEGFVDFEIRR